MGEKFVISHIMKSQIFLYMIQNKWL